MHLSFEESEIKAKEAFENGKKNESTGPVNPGITSDEMIQDADKAIQRFQDNFEEEAAFVIELADFP